MTTITTADAATEAHVSVATIRAWCRYGAVAAVKAAGRWVIDAASLAHRIALGIRRPRKTRPVELSVETMVAIGGNRWQKNGHDRVYINNWADFAGLEATHYKSGNVSTFAIGGRGVANGRAGRILSAVDKVWFDAADGRLHFRHYGADALDIRYLNGERDELNLLTLISTGIRNAIAAL